MDGTFTHVYDKNPPNVGKCTIHGWYGNDSVSPCGRMENKKCLKPPLSNAGMS